MAGAVDQLTYDLVIETKKAVLDIKSALDKSDQQAAKAGKTSGASFGNSFATAATAILGAISFNALIGGIKDSFNTFSLLDDKLADVRKTVGLTKNEAESFKDELFKVGKTTRTSIDELLGIAVIGGQFGRTKEEILNFTKNLNVLSVALGDEFPGEVEEAATQVSKIGTIFKEFKDESGRPTTDSILNIGNALNVLSADGAATSPVISEFATRIGSISDVIGLSAADVLGFSSTLQELAVEPERGSSAVTRVLQLIAKAPEKFASVVGLSGQEFKKIVNTDINEAFKMVSKSVAGGEKSATDFAQTLDELGLKGVYNTEIISKLGGNTDLLTKRQEQAAEALKNTDSLMSEYDIKNNNDVASVKKLENMMTAAKSEIGEAFAPVLIKAGEALAPLVAKITDFVKENPQFVAGIVLAVTAFTGLLTAGLVLAPVIGTIAGLFNPITLAIGGLVAWLSGTGGLTEAGKALNDIWDKDISPALDRFKIILDDTWKFLSTTFQPTFDALVKSFKEDLLPQLKSAWDSFYSLYLLLEPHIMPVLKSLGVILGATLIAGILALGIVLAGLALGFKLTFDGISWIINNVRAEWDKFTTGIKRGWEFAFGGLSTIAKTALNAVIDEVNKSLKSFNDLGNGFEKATGGRVNIPDIPQIPRLADGGLVTGKGTSRSDSIPAMLSNGEFVMNAQSVRRFFPILQAMNSNKPIPNQTDNRQTNVGNSTQYIYQDQYKQPDFSSLAYNY